MLARWNRYHGSRVHTYVVLGTWQSGGYWELAALFCWRPPEWVAYASHSAGRLLIPNKDIEISRTRTAAWFKSTYISKSQQINILERQCVSGSRNDRDGAGSIGTWVTRRVRYLTTRSPPYLIWLCHLTISGKEVQTCVGRCTRDTNFSCPDNYEFIR